MCALAYVNNVVMRIICVQYILKNVMFMCFREFVSV
jgi:hypothetical protein